MTDVVVRQSDVQPSIDNRPVRRVLLHQPDRLTFGRLSQVERPSIHLIWPIVLILRTVTPLPYTGDFTRLEYSRCDGRYT